MSGLPLITEYHVSGGRWGKYEDWGHISCDLPCLWAVISLSSPSKLWFKGASWLLSSLTALEDRIGGPWEGCG